MKKLVILFCYMLFFMTFILTQSVYASEMTSDGIEVSYTTNKEKYTSNDEIVTKLIVKNKNKYKINNFTAIVDIPNGYMAEDTSIIPQNITLKEREKRTYIIKLVKYSKNNNTLHKNKKLINIWLIFLIVFICIILGLAIFYYIYLKNKKAKIYLSMMLICSILGSLFSFNLDAEAAVIKRKNNNITFKILLNKKEVSLGITCYYDYNKQSDLLSIDTSEFGYNSDYNAFVVSKKIKGIKGNLKNAKKYDKIKLLVSDNKGNIILKKKIKPSDKWEFKDVGLFPGKNKIEVIAIGKKDLIAEIYLNDLFGLNYFNLKNSKRDSDKDQLYDIMEKYYGTDKNNIDTDSDGLTDFQEVNDLGTNPLVLDTDSNGVKDFNEDYDKDGIINGKEYKLGTSPVVEDSDFDGLSDFVEINQKRTNPLKKDTDGDGGDDYWEIINNYNPLVFNDSFNVVCETEKVSKIVPISAKVDVLVNNGEADVDSLEIEKVYTYDNPFISPSIAGYLGDAYNFSIDGSFDEANITFNYNKSLGTIGKDFQPRIYYFKEENMSFEELKNQKVINGKVTAKTTHFSTYVLLNKVEYDATWKKNKEITDKSKSLGPATFLYAVDSSASMAWNDKKLIQERIVSYFVDNLRDNYDYAAIEKFTKKSKMLCTFTKDKNELKDALKRVNIDNSVSVDSGTDGASALFDAINNIKKVDGTYRYILYFSDDKDNSFKHSYDEIISLAQKNNVEIYSIGIGIKKSKNLARLAEQTGGKCYFVDRNTSIDDKFSDTIKEIIAKTVDTNKDGISDYCTNLIEKGIIPLTNSSDELAGIDLNYDDKGNVSDDYDGDGLKNGEEIKIVKKGGNLCIEMTSNPFHKHSDGDGIDDYQEILNGSNPLQYSISKNNTDNLINRKTGFYYEKFYDVYNDDKILQSKIFLGGMIYNVGSIVDLYQEGIIDYYKNYAMTDKHSKEKIMEQKKLWVEYFATLLKNIKGIHNKTLERYDEIREIHKLWNQINGVRDEKIINHNFNERITKLVLKVNEISQDASQMRFNCIGIEYTKKILNGPDVYNFFKKSTPVLDNISTILCNGLEVADTINNIYSINIYCLAFKDNIDILDYISKKSKDKYARSAAIKIKRQLAGNFGNALMGGIKKVVILGGKNFVKKYFAKKVLEKIAKINPYVAAIEASIFISDLLFGVSDDIRQIYKILCYHEMSNAYTHCIKESIDIRKEFYEIKTALTSYFFKNMINIAQLRVLGEREFFEWWKVEGLLGNFINKGRNINEARLDVNCNILNVKLWCEYLGLKLSSKMKYAV